MGKRKKKEPGPTSWIVTARVVRTVVLTVEGCSREQAEDPDEVMNFVTDEQLSETTDWQVLDIEPNL